MEKNLSLLGAKFDVILYYIFLVGAKSKEHLAIIIVIKREWKFTKCFYKKLSCNIYQKMKPW